MNTSEVIHLKTVIGSLSIGVPTVTVCMMDATVQTVDITNNTIL